MAWLDEMGLPKLQTVAVIKRSLHCLTSNRANVTHIFLVFAYATDSAMQ